MQRSLKRKSQTRESGQTLILFTLFIIVLVLFVGLGIDLGFAYITQARLSKSVDAACLAGIRNYTSATVLQAEAIADSTFRANYGTSGRDVGAVTPNVSFDASSPNVTINVNATTTINTFFIRVLPQWKTLNVGSLAQATRPNLIMSLVLDRSGSMNYNNGWKALPPAVSDFIDLFDDVRDRVAVTTFASHARVDLPMTRPFKAQVKAVTPKIQFVDYDGGTGSQGGLTNGFVLNKNTVPALGEKVVKVVVFFTDGKANIIQDTLDCGGVPTLRNFGGSDAGDIVFFFDPSNGDQLCATAGGTPSCCSGVNQFQSAIPPNSFKSFTRANVTPDAEYRAIQVANEMRAEGMVVYSIGMGDDSDINKDFLRQVAGDPDNAVFAPSSDQLKSVFEIIGQKILARLTK